MATYYQRNTYKISATSFFILFFKMDSTRCNMKNSATSIFKAVFSPKGLS